MAVNKVSLIADVLYFIKNDLINNVTDPISSTRSTKSKFVMTSYPSRPVNYPIVTIKTTNVEALRSGMQVTAQDITINLEIRIWARNEKEKETIYQDVLNRLANIQYAASGSTANELHDFNILSSVEVDEPGEPGGKVIKSRVVQAQYKFYG
jgi:hypothetical protein